MISPAADAEHDDPGLLRLLHGLLPQQQLGSGKLIQHASLSSVLTHGINDSGDGVIFQWYKKSVPHFTARSGDDFHRLLPVFFWGSGAFPADSTCASFF